LYKSKINIDIVRRILLCVCVYKKYLQQTQYNIPVNFMITIHALTETKSLLQEQWNTVTVLLQSVTKFLQALSRKLVQFSAGTTVFRLSKARIVLLLFFMTTYTDVSAEMADCCACAWILHGSAYRIPIATFPYSGSNMRIPFVGLSFRT